MKRFFRISVALVAFLLIAHGVLRWQQSIQNEKGVPLAQGERLDAATGLCLEESRIFFYFYYYLDLLPITSMMAPTVYSKEGAEAFVKEYGRSLTNDLNKPCAIGRAGDWGKFLLLLPNAWETGSAAFPSTIKATAFLFKCALISVLAACFLTRRFALGIVLVLLVGSYRFQLYEAYFRNNVLSISITWCLLLLALNLRFISRNSAQPHVADFVIAASSGILLACGAVVRGDALPMSLSVLAAYTLSGQRIRRVLALGSIFVATLLSTGKGFEMYFDYKVRQATKFVTDAGGTLHAGSALGHHPVWHPIAAGLGDFGTDRGFIWDDLVIFKKALPYVNQKYNRKFVFQGYYYAEPGMAEHEWLKPETMPEYIDVVREMVISTIRTSPSWYIGILEKRWQRLEYTFSTVRLTWPNGDYSFPLTKWIFLPIVIACILSRRLDRLKVVAFSLPTCFVPLFITTAQGTANYTISHLVAAAVGIEASLFIAYWLGMKVVTLRPVRGLPPTTDAATSVAS